MEATKLATNIIKVQEILYDNKEKLDEDTYWEIQNNLQSVLWGIFRCEVPEEEAEELNKAYERDINSERILVFNK